MIIYRYIKKVIKFYKANKYLKKYKPRGCSLDEICKLEKELGFKLPAAYIEYLRWAGKDYQGLFIGSDAFIDDVLENNEALEETLLERKFEHFDQKPYVCFFCHQGYVFKWFYQTDNEDDPICYEYAEMIDGIKFGVSGKFSDVLFKKISDNIDCINRLNS